MWWAAVDNGLITLVADRVHKLFPENLGENGQLHTIHGIYNVNIDVPVFQALTRQKNQSVYARVFDVMK
ncbi:hypothetical protein ANCCAN_12886 [Ancylostoma caninum]|uniref:Uncharacterized protein n=1 Tax=Ancylostoma caninum TaxID=29170 RepID=A0A368G9V0_ANCCA|nr:hypothetical protein ANCCAN_12886 [Ancylostoma caninum]